MSSWKTCALAVLSLPLLAPAVCARDFPGTVSLRSEEVFQGGIVKIVVVSRELGGVQGILHEQTIPFFAAEDHAYAAFVGVDLEEKPGPMKIIIQGWSRDREISRTSVVVRIRDKTFPQETLSVDESFDRFDEATLKRIEKEQALMDRLWRLSGPRLWEGSFLSPVPGPVTSPFGLRRFINGSPRSPHSGIDFKASAGTEVVAANHGKVVLREELFFAGKSVVLDHGGGLYTMYFHLSEFGLNKGTEVRKGALIGRVGMTGRVTGPHLHWGARLNGARINPEELLALK